MEILDNKAEMTTSQAKRENNQNELTKKQQMKTRFIIACSIVLIILISYMIYIVRSKRA